MNADVMVVGGGVEAPLTGQVETAAKKVDCSSQPSPAPKVLFKQTNGALRKRRPLPTFVEGELFPLKGVWFRLIKIEDGNLVLRAVVSHG